MTQLFDLENDPAEMHDLSADPAQTTRVAAMMARLKKSQEVFGDALP